MKWSIDAPRDPVAQTIKVKQFVMAQTYMATGDGNQRAILLKAPMPVFVKLSERYGILGRSLTMFWTGCRVVPSVDKHWHFEVF